jgi:hypothetical protein
LPELREVGTLLLPILGKHQSARSWKRRFNIALTSLEEIAGCVKSAPEKFPRREIQVCSRMLYGPQGLRWNLASQRRPS